MGKKSFFDLVRELRIRSFAGCSDCGSFHGGCFRAPVAMLAIECVRSFCVDLAFQSASGDVKLWRDRGRKINTIKVEMTAGRGEGAIGRNERGVVTAW
jgi:hypothetical protein